MNEIKLSVEDKNLEVVLTVLENLKAGLLVNIQTNSKAPQTRRDTQYKPRTNTIIKEEESGTSDRSGKYVNTKAYKNRLKSKK